MTEISDSMVEAALAAHWDSEHHSTLALAIPHQVSRAEYAMMQKHMRAALQAALSQAPQGWKLVPVEPTDAMCEAGWPHVADSIADAYRAMLSAAPTDKG